MTSNDDIYDTSSDSEDSEIEYVPDYEIEDECSSSQGQNSEDEDGDLEAYADEPLADEEWLEKYETEKKEEEKLEKELKDRFDGTTEIKEWCKCGNCDRHSLQNISECYGCQELDGCVEAFTSEPVLQDLAPNAKLVCITDHPGFNPVCLQKWSLRLAADKYKTKGKKKYGQTGSEESFLRSVTHREFSRLVYGFLGNRRIPLPACAYVAIRKAFPCDKDELYAGFDLDEDE